MMPTDVEVVDCWIGFETDRPKSTVASLRSRLRLGEDLAGVHSPVDYLFKDDLGKPPAGEDPVKVTLAQMDRFGVAIGLVEVSDEPAPRAVREYPDRFQPTQYVDPSDITGAVRSIRRAHDEFAIRAVYSFPAGSGIPIDDRRYYPVYQTCVDLDLPIIMNAGIVGPRVPSAAQDVMLFDQVCYDFPELRIVMCHGAEPWEELAIKLMLKWPGLHYMTSAFAPKYYPPAIIDYANTRGAEKIIYAGYYPDGLTLERIFKELAHVPLRAGVWPKFLSENARRVFKL
jgi:uncharacterized protein